MLRTTLEDMAPGVAECKSPLTQGGSSEQRLTVARLVTGIVLEAELHGKTARVPSSAHSSCLAPWTLPIRRRRWRRDRSRSIPSSSIGRSVIPPARRAPRR